MSFDLRKFLTENKLTRPSRLISEQMTGFSVVSDDGSWDHPVVTVTPNGAGSSTLAFDSEESGESVTANVNHTPEELEALFLNNGGVVKVDGTYFAKNPELLDNVLKTLGVDVDSLFDTGLQETLDDQPVDRDPTDGAGVATSFDPSKYESVEQLMKEIEITANKAALQEKMKRVKEAYESLEQKASALEEGEDSKYISSAKLQEMKRNSKTLRKMYEKYEKDYNKRFNEEMKPKKKMTK